jgi:hypothetical protein
MLHTTQTSERGLEQLIASYRSDKAGYIEGNATEFDLTHVIDPVHLFRFLRGLVHFAADDNFVYVTTKLDVKDPFLKGADVLRPS